MITKASYVESFNFCQMIPLSDDQDTSAVNLIMFVLIEYEKLQL